MATKDFIVFDSDSHVVEPPALWEKYLDPEYRTLGKHALWRQEGRTGAYLKVNGEMFRDKGNPNLPRHALWRPGMDWDAIGALDPLRAPTTTGSSTFAKQHPTVCSLLRSCRCRTWILRSRSWLG